MKKIYTSVDIGSDTIRILVSEYFQGKLRTLAVSSVRSKGVKNGIIIDENNISYNKTISYYVRKLDISSEPNLINIINIVNNTKNFKKNNFAGDHINIYNAKEYIEILWKKLDINQTILIENYDTIY